MREAGGRPGRSPPGARRGPPGAPVAAGIRAAARAAVLATALAALGAAIPAAAESPAATTPAATPLTAIEAGPLGRSDRVVVGVLDGVEVLRDMALARVRPERVLKGGLPAGQGLLTVFVRGPRPTTDREAPSAPYLTAQSVGRRFVFFLLPGEGDSAGWLEALFDAEGSVGAEKVAALEEHARLLAVPDREERARATLAYLLRASRSGGTWTRVHAARELNHLAGAVPALFDAEARRSIRLLASRGALPAQREWLLRLLERFEATPAAGEETAAEAPTGEEALAEALAAARGAEARLDVREAFLRSGGEAALPAVFSDLSREEAAVRAAFLDRLAEGGWRSALPRIRALYAFETAPEVLGAIVRATGRLGGPEDVPWLAARLANPRVRREALFALARIRTDEAKEVLARDRERAVLEGAAAGDLPALIDYLLGPVFLEAEADAGRRR